jgi:hypothetical protein
VGQKIYMYDRNQNTGNLLPIKELIHEWWNRSSFATIYKW